jgi:hypothetical protein
MKDWFLKYEVFIVVAVLSAIAACMVIGKGMYWEHMGYFGK